MRSNRRRRRGPRGRKGKRGCGRRDGGNVRDMWSTGWREDHGGVGVVERVCDLETEAYVGAPVGDDCGGDGCGSWCRAEVGRTNSFGPARAGGRIR